jgi:hypothetical protein
MAGNKEVLRGIRDPLHLDNPAAMWETRPATAAAAARPTPGHEGSERGVQALCPRAHRPCKHRTVAAAHETHLLISCGAKVAQWRISEQAAELGKTLARYRSTHWPTVEEEHGTQ